jgi:uncharacterized protein YbjT (DUF2867 family)
VRWPFGDARRSLIHEADIAAAARVALLDSAHDGKRYVLTGPAALSQREQVETIGTALGRRLSWVEMPTDEALAMLAPALGDAFADAALREWQRFVSNPEPVNNEVATLTGREPRTFAEWADEHKSQFGGS